MKHACVGLLLLAQATTPLAGFEPTGEKQRCVQSYRIRETRVLDDSTILFRLGVRDDYVNHLRQSCPLLKIQGGFRYDLRGGNELCRGDAIRVLDPAGAGAGCLLGDFEKVTVTEKKAQPSAK